MERKTVDDIQTGLSICSVWVHDENDSIHKECKKCPYKSPDDPCGLNCGEHLMTDAGLLIEAQRKRIESMEAQVANLNMEMVKAANRSEVKA